MIATGCKMKNFERLRKLTRSEDGAVAMTTTANLPFNQLIAPSSPRSRNGKGPKQSGQPSNSLGIVRRTQPESRLKEFQPRQAHTDLKPSETFPNMSGNFGDFSSSPGPTEDTQIPEKARGYPANYLMVPPVRQTFGFCGPAALCSVLNFFGANTTEQQVAESASAEHSAGVEAEQLVKAARSFGYRAEYKQGGDSGTVEDLIGRRRIPFVFFWFGHGKRGDGGHASVACGFDDTSVYVMDPEIGLVVPKPWEKFLSSWLTFSGTLPTKDGLRVGEHLIITPSDW